MLLKATALSVYAINCRSPRWQSGSWMNCGLGDPGLIPSIPSLRVGPLIVRKLKMSWDVPVPMSEWAWHTKDL